MDQNLTAVQIITAPGPAPGNPAAAGLAEIKTEAVRKSFHFLIALSPGMAAINYVLTVGLLTAGILFYACAECLRLAGVQVPLVSKITKLASRNRDDGRLVLGPITLGIGALTALLLFPAPVAAIGVYALAFGDGLASLAGKLCGSIRPSFMMGKSIEGSTACFAAVLASAFLVSHNIQTAVVAAVVATVVEALPLENYDNIAIPVSVAFIVRFMPL
jgi:dolichol kinase